MIIQVSVEEEIKRNFRCKYNFSSVNEIHQTELKIDFPFFISTFSNYFFTFASYNKIVTCETNQTLASSIALPHFEILIPFWCPEGK